MIPGSSFSSDDDSHGRTCQKVFPSPLLLEWLRTNRKKRAKEREINCKKRGDLRHTFKGLDDSSAEMEWIDG